MTISATATFNNTTNKVNIAYELTGNYSFYICWSDTTTDDYSALISGGHYDLVSGQQSGTWSETANPPSVGNTRYYYFVDPYSYSLITSTSYTALPTPAATQLSSPVVTTTATADTITPSWSNVSNAFAYRVRYSTSNPPTGDGTTTTSGTAITGLTASTTYYVQVKAVGDGTSYSDSEWSTVVNVVTSALAITDFDASLVTGGTLCTFTAPAGIETTSTVAWQRSTDNSNFTTIQTTDLSGTAVTV